VPPAGLYRRLVAAGPTVATGGIQLAYEVSGIPAAPPMVLLHGLGERGASMGLACCARAGYSWARPGPE